MLSALNKTVEVYRILEFSYDRKSSTRKASMNFSIFCDFLILFPKLISFRNRNATDFQQQNEGELFDMRQRIAKAHDYASRKLYSAGITGSVHALPFNIIIELCNQIVIKPFDSFWDIGVGEPLLAFSLSAAAVNGMVLGTELSKLCHFV